MIRWVAALKQKCSIKLLDKYGIWGKGWITSGLGRRVEVGARECKENVILGETLSVKIKTSNNLGLLIKNELHTICKSYVL